MFEKKSLKKRLNLYLTSRILRLLLIIIMITCRKKWFGREVLETLKKNDQNWIYSLWHNNISYAAYLLKRQKLLSLVSSSDDGRFAATVIQLFGNKTISGSTTRGGARALLAMIKGIKSGSIGAITPDGPRGPRYELQKGAVYIAQKSNSPLVPMHVESTRQWIFKKSWDKHKFPKPFSTIVISIGNPYYVDPKTDNKDLESERVNFEKEMMSNVRIAEESVNRLRI